MLTTERRDDFFLIHCAPNLSGVNGTELLKLLQANLEAEPKGIVLDLSPVVLIDRGFHRTIGIVGKSLRDAGRRFIGLGAKADLARELRENALHQSITLVADWSELAREGSPVAPKLNVALVNPFIQAATLTFASQCKLPVRTGRPSLKEAGQLLMVDIAGVLPLRSPSFNGFISLAFPAPVFLAAMEGMMGAPCPALTDEIKDGAAELLNMIFGQAKVELNAKGFGIEMARPTVLTGAALAAVGAQADSTILLPFKCERGVFYMEIGAGGAG